ncbi:Acyl-CoA dehydrogenase apdG like protein [Verticillium longisporum]|nr:Acyl-CoA dehydrogenase apdG like protein [Verticillium longisporum]
MASLNLSSNGQSIKSSYQGVINGPAPSSSSPTYAQWALFSVQAPLANAFQDSGSKESILKVQSTGDGELAELIEDFSEGRIQFAFVKVKDPNSGLPKYALIAWCGGGVPERTKGYFTTHTAADLPEEAPDVGRGAAAAVAQQELSEANIPAAQPPAGAQAGGQRALIQYDYEKAEDNEVELREGQYVTNIEMVDEDWWMGTNSKGESGLFPSNYVELVEDEPEQASAAAPAPAARSLPPPAPAQAEPEPQPQAAGRTATALFDYEAAEDNAIMTNFNHERIGIIIQCLRFSRVCYSESVSYASKRRTFGKKLIEHPVIRLKLAHMARQIEASYNWLENLMFQCQKMGETEAMLKLGGAIAGLKAQSTVTFEFCAREASQIFGGLSYSRGGQGGKVERLYRDVRAYAIPGGSEEIMLDLSIRQSMRVNKALGMKLQHDEAAHGQTCEEVAVILHA